MRLIDADELKGRTTNFDEEGCRIWHEWDIDNAPTVDDERTERALETIQTVIDNTNGRTDNMAKLMRNTAKFIRNAIDGEMPDYENVEGEDCGERPKGKWVCLVPPDFLDFYPIPFECSCCNEALYFARGSEKEATICPFCGADMRGEADNGDDI